MNNMLLSKEGFTKIWNLQSELNRMVNRDTLAIGNSNNLIEKLHAIRDYIDAYNHEIFEARNEFYWKWWSKEVKNGSIPRFQIKDKAHLKIELIDALHFIVSALQCANGSIHYWTYEESLWKIDDNLKGKKMNDEELSFYLHDCMIHDLSISFNKFRKFMLNFVFLGISEQEIIEIYEKKHAINVQRQKDQYSVQTKTEADNDSLAKELDAKDSM